ncbi:MAG: DEAD/DEAH box helicase [Planctomycetota bacterium]|nr:DEAD/DEAH box helicase [Planctomycetota bacterium]
MQFDPSNPLIVQGDRSVLVEVDNPRYTQARDAIAPFAELEKSPEHIHTYRLTPLSLWNAAAAGLSAESMVEALTGFSKFPVPGNLLTDLREIVSRYGRLKLERATPEELAEVTRATGQEFPVSLPGLGIMKLVASDRQLLDELGRQPKLKKLLGEHLSDVVRLVDPANRGVLKQVLVELGYPAQDMAGYTDGAALPMELRENMRDGLPFHVRDYQKDAAAVFYAGGDVSGGSGVVVLPCGAGKTVVGITAMCLMKRSTLVLTTGITAVKQWCREILDKTDLPIESVGEYTGENKTIRPVTVATYQILSHREDKTGDFPHFGLFDKQDWGLIIYDEVHLLPAPVFRITAQIQARRRLGLTATLVREDGREGDVFSLVGPKKYDVPWRELEGRGFIAEAACAEVRVAMDTERRMEYAVAEWRSKFRIASDNPAKDEVVAALLHRFKDHRVIVIGQYLEQLRRLRSRFQIPLITGITPTSEREELYNRFRNGEERHLILSKVGNFALDLPDASVLIQVSGTFGSRQEEAQRLGRVLRPKSGGETAHFFTLVSRDSREQDFAHHRQLFLTEQGYSYRIADGEELMEEIRAEGPMPATEEVPQPTTPRSTP